MSLSARLNSEKVTLQPCYGSKKARTSHFTFGKLAIKAEISGNELKKGEKSPLMLTIKVIIRGRFLPGAIEKGEYVESIHKYRTHL